jgi:hypothetical protein
LVILAAGLLVHTGLAQIPPSTLPLPVSPLPGTLPGVPHPPAPGVTSVNQCGSGQLTVPANYLNAYQVPNTWRLGQIVIGQLNFTTNGKSPEYSIGADRTATEIDEEHSVWCLTYNHAAGYTLKTGAKWWHQKTEIKTGFLNASYDTTITVTTQDSIQSAPSDGQPTLTIQKGGSGLANYRAVVMSSGVSLPQIYTETGKMVFYLKGGVNGKIVNNPGNGPMSPDLHPMTVFLQIGNWMLGKWDTPYSGEITAQNDYVDYHTRPLPGIEWLEVHAIWNTKPGPGQ